MSGEDSPTSVALRAAAELKSAAAELGDADGRARQQRFLSILQSAEKSLAPQQHPEFYKALTRWFPASPTETVGGNLGGSSGASATAPAAPSPRSPEEVLAAIKSVLPTLSPKDRQAFLGRLSELVPAQSAGSTSQKSSPQAPVKLDAFALAPETLRVLGVANGTPIDINRLAPFFGMLIEVLVRIDDVAWGIWESFGTDSKGLRRELVMKKAFGALLAGQTKLTVPQLQMQIAHLQRITVELLAQMNRVGEHAKKHLTQISPQTITQEEEAASRTWSIMKPLPSRCWERFTAQWPDVEANAQSAVNKEIAKAVSAAVNVQRF